MFFLTFTISIRIFTLFLNFSYAEKTLIPLILLTSIIRVSLKSIKDIGFGKYNKNSTTKIFQLLGKTVFRGLIGNIVASTVIIYHLNSRDCQFVQVFLGKEDLTEKESEWENFNGFIRIYDTQKYHKYYAETQNGKIYSLSSENDYHIGDILFLSATEKDLDYENIFSSTESSVFSKDFWDYQFNYDKRLFMKGVNGSLYEKQSLNTNCTLKEFSKENKDNKTSTNCENLTIQGKSPNFKPLGFTEKSRTLIQNTIISKMGENKFSGLLLGLLIGDKSMIPSEDYDTFVNSGLVHIIAVSGGNIAMVLILLGFLFSRLPFYLKNFLLVIGIILYSILCGSDASVIRAAIMGSLTLIALFRGREISIRRAMLYAFFIILIINPFSLGYDIGFILSFSAIIGIVLFQKLSDNRGKSNEKELNNKKEKSDFFQCKFRKEYLVPTIGASLGTAPILIFFMNGVNLLGIILNIFIVPIIPIVTIYGLISIALSLITPRRFRLIPEKLLMNIVYGLSKLGAKFAIFIQSDILRKKYIIVALFLLLGILAYRIIFHKSKKLDHKSSTSQNNKGNQNHILDDILDDIK